MIVRRIRLENFRGVERSEVHFAAKGVTIVVGPNESGKSSLTEALRLIFEVPHDSQRKEIKEIKPVHADVPTSIEVDIETGPYQFGYFKQFHERARTELQLRAPMVQTFTARDAHDKALAIRAETLDEGLWRALSIEQGKGLGQPALLNQRWLSSALDAAAGAGGTDWASETLLERARAECAEYLTGSKFQEVGRTKRLQEELAEKQATLARCALELSKLERALNRRQELQASLPELQAEERRHREALEALDARERELQTKKHQLESKRSELRVAQAQEGSTKRARDERQQQLESQRTEQAKLNELTIQRQCQEKTSAAAKLQRESTELSRREAEQIQDQALLRQKEAIACFERLREYNSLQQAALRLETVEQLAAQIGELEFDFNQRRVDAAVLEHLQELASEVKLQQEKQSVVGARLRLRSSVDTEVQDGVKTSTLHKMELREFLVHQPLHLVVGGLEIEVLPGASADEVRQCLERAERRLFEALAEHGLGDLEAAKRAQLERAATESALTTARAQLQGLLQGEELSALRSRVQREMQRLRPWPIAPVTAADLEKAQQGRKAADEALLELQLNTRAAQDSEKNAQQAEQQAELKLRGTDSTLTEVSQQLALREKALEEARRERSDEELAQQVMDLEHTVQRLQAECLRLEGEYNSLGPDSLEQALVSARAQHKVSSERNAAEIKERERLDTQLETLGEQGLREQHDELERQVERGSGELARLRRRAKAAKLLLDTLLEARSQQQRAYQAPLAAEIERLGQLVLGEDLRVEIDHELVLTHCTRSGRRLGFEALSTGTKEQLGLILRLACAQLAASQGGVPLFLDDVLGHSDAKRLASMSRVISRAGEYCQIVLLTCSAERYAGIRPAEIVRL